MKIVYATDLHGNARLYEKVLKETEKKAIGALVIGGDMTPFLGFDAMSMQRAFLEDYFVPRLEKFAIKAGKPVLVMMGNDDFSINHDLLEKADAGGTLKLMHNNVVSLGRFSVAGYSFIALTPFMLKDWERSEDEIAADLRKLSSKTDVGRTIFVFHTPPANTNLDMLYNGSHAGSTAVLGFIKRKQPLATLHGHIHESRAVTGVWKQKIGRTISMNPGCDAFIIVDLEKPDASVLKKF